MDPKPGLRYFTYCLVWDKLPAIRAEQCACVWDKLAHKSSEKVTIFYCALI